MITPSAAAGLWHRSLSAKSHRGPYVTKLPLGTSTLPQSSSHYGSEVRGTSCRRLLHGGRESALSTRQCEDVTSHVWNLQCHREYRAPEEPTHVARHSGPACPARANDNTWLRDALMTAIQRDNTAEIEALVLKGAPLWNIYCHQLGPGGRSRFVNPVDWAALEQCFRPALQLLELSQRCGGRGLTPGLPQVAGRTVRAVYMAAQHGQMELLHKLLENSAVPGQQNSQRESALHAAVRTGHSEAAALLLQYGAWAVEEQRCDVLKSALVKGVACVLEGAGVPSTEAQRLTADISSFDSDLDPHELQCRHNEVERALEPYTLRMKHQSDITKRHRVQA